MYNMQFCGGWDKTITAVDILNQTYTWLNAYTECVTFPNEVLIQISTLT